MNKFLRKDNMNKMQNIKYLFFALRPKQWLKNFFIFLPMLFGGRLFDSQITMEIIFAFILFSMASSSVYLFNDIIDLKNDKLHPLKKLRPLPSGKISVFQASFVASVLAIFLITFSFILDINFGYLIIIYLSFNIIYSMILKHFVVIDVFSIGFFFLLRILAGCIIAEVILSHWIVFCTVLLALFIGFNKRRHELKLLKKRAYGHRSVLDSYSPYFIDQMVSVITSSIVVVYMLYTVDGNTVRNVGSDHLIYSIPLVYYGIFRYLYLIHKRGKGGDPTNILLNDKKLQIDLILWVIVCITIVYFKF